MFLAISFSSIGMFLLKLLLLFFVLGVIILVHEFGHFIWAKKFGVHIYEFSIGMGPIIHTHTGKDKIDYNFRALPIGGFVSMAGEVYDDDDKVPKKKLLCNKPWHQRLIIMVAGVVNNFILAILLLIIYAAIWGGSPISPTVSQVVKDSPAEKSGLVKGDTIKAINGHKVGCWDKAQIVLYYKYDKKTYTFKVEHKDGQVETLKIRPDVTENEDGTKTRTFGFGIKPFESKNPFKIIGYGFARTATLVDSFATTIWGLITGKIALNNLSGPVGIYTIVGESVGLKLGDAINYLIYLIAYLCINVGFINILPFPAFDGGHVLFLLIEKVFKKPVDSNIENTCHLIGFILIFLLMIIVTIGDIIKLF